MFIEMIRVLQIYCMFVLLIKITKFEKPVVDSLIYSPGNIEVEDQMNVIISQ